MKHVCTVPEPLSTLIHTIEMIMMKQTLEENYLKATANGGKIGFAGLTFASRGPDNPLFERRLKINKTGNVTIDYLNENNTYLRTH